VRCADPKAIVTSEALKEIAMNQEVIRPKLSHYGVVTGQLDDMKAWYGTVLGMTIVHESDHVFGEEVTLPFEIRACWVTNDEADHRIGLVGVQDMPRDHNASAHSRYHHLAFEYADMNELLDTYVRLKQEGIIPLLCADHGPTSSLYYSDPDRNIVELLTNNFGDWRKSKDFMRLSPEFARKPMGEYFDPDKVVAARDAGATPSEIHQRIYRGREWSPDQPVNPRVIM
jgi:catechol 2,3-dioxygenase-like lactoylglutathione lyase family enzyme